MKIKSLLLLSAIAAIAMVSCNSKKANYEAMVSKEWQLASIQADDLSYTVTPKESVTIIFSDSSTFAGNGGCNSYFGVYSTYGNEIDVEVQGRSMATCPEINFEDKYIELLNGCSTFFAEGNNLQLNNNEVGVTLKFEELKK